MKKIFIPFSLLVLLAPLLVGAQVVSLKSAASSYEVGDSFSVSVSINTEGQSINTISGKITVPPSLLRLVDVRYGNSFLSLWVEKPVINTIDNTISFTGGVPGGFNGSNGPILSFGLRALRDGTGVVALRDLKVLLNDGEGTEIPAVSKDISIKIVKPIAKPVKPSEPIKTLEPMIIYLPPPDDTPPEPFIPLVSQHESIENNAYFVSFSTTDKISGISYYLVREEPIILPFGSTDWATSTSPYTVQNQIWPARIYVRAYDLNGNYFEAQTRKPLHQLVFWGMMGLLLLIFIAVIFIIIRRDRRKYKTLLDRVGRRK